MKILNCVELWELPEQCRGCQQLGFESLVSTNGKLVVCCLSDMKWPGPIGVEMFLSLRVI